VPPIPFSHEDAMGTSSCLRTQRVFTRFWRRDHREVRGSAQVIPEPDRPRDTAGARQHQRAADDDGEPLSSSELHDVNVEPNIGPRARLELWRAAAVVVRDGRAQPSARRNPRSHVPHERGADEELVRMLVVADRGKGIGDGFAHVIPAGLQVKPAAADPGRGSRPTSVERGVIGEDVPDRPNVDLSGDLDGRSRGGRGARRRL